jgi:hypothetical protein
MSPAMIHARFAIALAVSVVAGIAIGWMDSRPGYDDTGVTAVALVFAASVASFTAARRPWLWAITTGIWVPLLELPAPTSTDGPLLALAFASGGAAIGWLAVRR